MRKERVSFLRGQARVDADTHTQTISTQETKTERRAATQAHITHTTYSKLQTDV